MAEAGAHVWHEAPRISILATAKPPSSCPSASSGVSFGMDLQCGLRRSNLVSSKRSGGSGNSLARRQTGAQSVCDRLADKRLSPECRDMIRAGILVAIKESTAMCGAVEIRI